MQPIRKDIEIYQGEDFVTAFKLNNAEGLKLTFKSDIKRKKADTVPLLSFDVEQSDDLIILSLPAGKSNAITMQADKEKYYYDIKMTLNGQTRYIKQGEATMYRTVTK